MKNSKINDRFLMPYQIVLLEVQIRKTVRQERFFLLQPFQHKYLSRGIVKRDHFRETSNIQDVRFVLEYKRTVVRFRERHSS